jgi:hypothetical protein
MQKPVTHRTAKDRGPLGKMSGNQWFLEPLSAHGTFIGSGDSRKQDFFHSLLDMFLLAGILFNAFFKTLPPTFHN